jgi:uncharacterized membrane protein YbhN (UPF0104 family)
VAIVVLVVVRGGPILARLGRLPSPNAALLGLAVAAEAGSVAAYALMARRILRLQGTLVGLGVLLRLTVAGVAMSSSLPAGDAAAAAYWIRELGHEGADHAQASILLVRSLVAQVVSIAVLLVVGVAVAGRSGPLPIARTPLLVTGGIVLVLIPIVWIPLSRVVHRRFPPGVFARDPGRGRAILGGLVVAMLVFAFWGLDCAALGLAVGAVHVPVAVVPTLVTYCLAQVVAIVPLLPGGAGTVEAALIGGFHAFGATGAGVVAGVLIYRAISTWGIVPIGWGSVAVAGRMRSRTA